MERIRLRQGWRTDRWEIIHIIILSIAQCQYKVRGKYGYYDPEGVLREASYGATKVVINMMNMMVLTMRTMKIIGIWVLRLLKNIEKIRDLL